ncbi:MAG TPA: DUF2550 domain-containing protein [Cryptosporangiaceae bacterium]|nr:DUF2550 domain-containing protein [Cryptosporangiaceae bacterium]
MNLLDGLGALLALAAVLGLALLIALFVRRTLIARGGSVELSIRLSRRRWGRGWALGIARYSGDQLLWYRMFSLAPRPRRVLTRQGLTVVQRREPSDRETVALMSGSVVLECSTPAGPVELAMSGSALTGFLSWLESAAPGGKYPPYAAR